MSKDKPAEEPADNLGSFETMSMHIFSLVPDQVLALSTCLYDAKLVVTIQRYATEAETLAFYQLRSSPGNGLH